LILPSPEIGRTDSLTLSLELFYPPVTLSTTLPLVGEARTGSKPGLSNRPEKRWDPPEPTWQEGGGICALLLNPGSEQHPKRLFGLVGVGSGDLPERVRKTLKVTRITLS